MLCSDASQECDEVSQESSDDSQETDRELLLTLKYANNPSHCNRNLKITSHPNPGLSGAEIYILHGNKMSPPKIAKIFKCQSPGDLKLGFLELSNSLVALSINPDPSNIKMTRIHSAGYSFFHGSKEPYIFCMLFEKASGHSVKELLHDKFFNSPFLFDEVLKDNAQCLAYFHVNSSREFNKNNKIDTEIKKAEIKDREEFCRRRIRLLLQDSEFNPKGGAFFNFEDALKSIEDIFSQGIQTPIKHEQPQPRSSRGDNNKENNDRNQTKRSNCRFIWREKSPLLERVSNQMPQDSNSTFPSNLGKPQNDTLKSWEVINKPSIEQPFSFAQHLRDILNNFEKWNLLAIEDRVLTLGDMHIGNLCYKKKQGTSRLHRSTFIDFSSMKRSYGAIGDPAQDVGKYLGSIWKEVAIYLAKKYGDKDSMETWYNTLCKWEEVYLSTYIEAYTLGKSELHKTSTPHSTATFKIQESNIPLNIMTTFRERVYFYKLCLYAQFFDDTRIQVDQKGMRKAQQILLYFFLRESRLLGLRNLGHTLKEPVPLIRQDIYYGLYRMDQTGRGELMDQGTFFLQKPAA